MYNVYVVVWINDSYYILTESEIKVHTNNISEKKQSYMYDLCNSHNIHVHCTVHGTW